MSLCKRKCISSNQLFKVPFLSLSFTIFFFPQSLLPTSQFYSSFANSFLLFKLFLKPDKGFLLSAPKHPSEPLPKPESGICDHNDDQPIILRGDICACTHLPDWSKSWPGRHCVVKYWVDCRVDVEHQAREIQKVEVDLRCTRVRYLTMSRSRKIEFLFFLFHNSGCRIPLCWKCP